MADRAKRVLVVATSRDTKGGVSAVIKAHEQCPFWKEYDIRWLETHIDGNILKKFFYAVRSFLQYIFILPGYDLVHIHLSEIPSMMRKIPFFLYARLSGKNIIIHFHSFSPATTINSRFRPFYKYLFLRADRVIVLSGMWKKWIEEYLGIAKNVVVVYNPSPVVGKREMEREKKILYAGALNKRKGYADLIRAFSMVSDQCPDWALVFAGNGEIENGKHLAEQAGIAGKVFFAGWVTGEEKEHLFSTAGIFCLPSYAEGFPTAILEACSYGLPLIATPVGGIPDVIQDQINGLLFHPGDVRMLSTQLLALIQDNELRARLGAASLNLSKTVFSLQETGRQIGSLYKGLLY